MARQTKQTQIEALRTENEQLRALLAQAHTETLAAQELARRWEFDARRARREIVKRGNTPVVARGGAIGQLAAAYCEAHGVKVCTREQALSMAQSAQGGAALACASLRLVKEHGEIRADWYDDIGDPAFYGSSHDVYEFDGAPQAALEEARREFRYAEVVELRADGHIHVLRF